MKTRHVLVAGLALLAAVLVYTLLVYPALPERVPIHWNLRGQVDGWADKRWAVLFGPCFMAVIIALTYLLPVISPRQFRIEPFQKTFNYVMLLMVGMGAFIGIGMLQAALHPHTDMGRVLVGGVFLIMGLMGNVMGRTRRNYWMGWRTPWTLASETVWRQTHRLAARMTVAAGLLGAVAVWLGAPLPICFVLVIAAFCYPALYSYFAYRRLYDGAPPTHQEG